MQTCGRCQQAKPSDAFHPGKRGKVGHYCRACCAEYARGWRTNNYRDRRGARRGLPQHPVFIRVPKVPRRKRGRYLSSYQAAHKRIRVERGPAAAQQCAHCDQMAAHWAYDHTDPNEMKGTTARGRPASFSADPSRYLPLCRSCHTLLDARCSACGGPRTGQPGPNFPKRTP